ncbi:DUF6807 family protein [Arthrobacter sp. MDT2-16]
MSDRHPLLTPDGRTAGILHDGADEPEGHAPRPFLHPVLTPRGLAVSDYRPADHLWHWGLGIAVSNIDVAGQDLPVNLWGGPTYREGHGYVHLPNNGSQQVRAGERREGGVLQHLDWRAADGAVVLTEERSWISGSVRTADVEWTAISVRSRWVNTGDGPLAFGSPTTAGRPNAGYGGFFLRLAPSFDGAEIVAPRAGDPQGSAGATVTEADAMGSTRPWLGMRSDDASVLMVPAADNPGEGSPWFVRSSGTPMLCAAPFFHRKLHLEAGGTLDWAWSLLVADEAVDEDAFAAAASPATRVRPPSEVQAPPVT